MISGILLTSYGLATKINTSGGRPAHGPSHCSLGLFVMAADVLCFLQCHVEFFFLFRSLHVLTTNMPHLHVQ